MVQENGSQVGPMSARCKNCDFPIVHNDNPREKPAQAKGFCCSGCAAVSEIVEKMRDPKSLIHYRGKKRINASKELTESGELTWETEENRHRTQPHVGDALGADGELQWDIKPRARWQRDLFKGGSSEK